METSIIADIAEIKAEEKRFKQQRTVPPTSDRWIKVDDEETLILTALSHIKSIALLDGNGGPYEVRYYFTSDRSNEYNSKYCYTLAEAEAFRDEILAKIDRL